MGFGGGLTWSIGALAPLPQWFGIMGLGPDRSPPTLEAGRFGI